MLSRTPIGGLLLEEAEEWKFVVHDGVIAGTYQSEPGILRIATIPSTVLPQPVTHDACLARSAELAKLTNPRPADWTRFDGITGPYGSVNFDRAPDRIYVWYCCRSPGLIVGAYSCSTEVSRTWANHGVRMQCDRMITTAIFDRRTWGGDDELTRMLIALLGADEAQDGSQDEPQNKA